MQLMFLINLRYKRLGEQGLGGAHGYTIHLVVESTFE